MPPSPAPAPPPPRSFTNFPSAPAAAGAPIFTSYAKPSKKGGKKTRKVRTRRHRGGMMPGPFGYAPGAAPGGLGSAPGGFSPAGMSLLGRAAGYTGAVPGGQYAAPGFGPMGISPAGQQLLGHAVPGYTSPASPLPGLLGASQPAFSASPGGFGPVAPGGYPGPGIGRAAGPFGASPGGFGPVAPGGYPGPGIGRAAGPFGAAPRRGGSRRRRSTKKRA